MLHRLKNKLKNKAKSYIDKIGSNFRCFLYQQGLLIGINVRMSIYCFLYLYSSFNNISKMYQVSQEQINCVFETQGQVKIFDQDNWAHQQQTRQSHQTERCTPINISTQKAIPIKQNKTQQKHYDNKLIKKIQRQLQNSKDNFFKVNITKNTNQKKQSFHINNSSQVCGQKMTINTRSMKRIQSIGQKNPNSIIKQGLLQKKTDNFISLFCWKTRFFALTSQKLYFFEDKKKEKVIGCINFKLMHTLIKKSQKNLEITLDFMGQSQNLILRCGTKKQYQQWSSVLQQVLKYNQKQQKICLKTMIKPLYECQDSISEKQFLKIAQTGDILLFYTRNIGAKIQRVITNSDFDHVAMIIKFGKNQTMVFESNQVYGVSIYQWAQYIRYFDLYDKVTLRKLHSARKQQMHHTFLSFTKKNLGKKYDLNAYKLLKLQSDFNWQTTKQTNDQNQARGFFCSQLIAKAYKSLGLLQQKKSSGRYWPVDFSEKAGLQLRNGAYLGSQQSIVLNRHIKRKAL